MNSAVAELPRLYTDFAEWWPLLSSPADYAEEAAFYLRTMQEASTLPLHMALELGSGGGNNASHLKAAFRMALVDPSPGMMRHSLKLNPECEHFPGDMRDVRLGRVFDAVFIHDAIAYMTTETDLRKALRTAWVHLRPGGVALFAPDHVRETFAPSTSHGGHDGPDRAMRYLEWTWDPDPSDTLVVADYAYVFRKPDGSIEAVADRHMEGLFARDDWMRLLGETGFEGARVVPFDHSELEPGTYEIFVARRPAAP